MGQIKRYAQYSQTQLWRTYLYNELTLTVKRFSFPVILLHVVNFRNITNYA